ncbi:MULTISPECIES: TauD/TfdA dioxygenase family protein [unclassified Sphingomonas]|uniref:TauD/TfdA dioxygenase family protein n=1 Tax=unclassified Sphingomonas TaxID=196159 RepID=UPI0009EC649C|nr:MULTISPECIES: TauD/TfdA family dioxygenase [unclassified Sphingomonas]
MTSDMEAPFQTSALRDGLPFGAAITGLDPTRLSDPRVREALREIWTDKGVLVFHGLEGEDVHLELSRVFGTLVQHPTRETRAAHPELMTVRYRPETGWLIDVDGELRGTWLPWHSDLIYVDRINRGGILRPLVLPSRLGQTGFIDKIGAYRTLPDALKARIEGLNVIYKYDLDAAHQRFGRTTDAKMVRISPDVASIQARLDDFPRVIHPMVYEQRETGRKVLNVSPWFAVGIQGMETAEGDALLAEVADHIVRSEEVYLHDWQLGDMVLWDNWRVLHSATGCPPDEERWMLRTTIEGDYGLGRTEADAAIDRSDYITV